MNVDQYILVIKFVWTQLQHLEESKQLQDKEEDFDIMEDSGSTILTARHVSLGAHNTNIFLHSWNEAKDSVYKDFSKWLIKWLTANLILQFSKLAASIKLDPDDKVSIHSSQ